MTEPKRLTPDAVGFIAEWPKDYEALTGFTVHDFDKLIEQIDKVRINDLPTIQFYKNPVGPGYIGLLNGSVQGSLHVTDEQFEAYQAKFNEQLKN